MSLQKKKIIVKTTPHASVTFFFKNYTVYIYIYSSKNRFQQSYLPWKGSVWNMKMKNIYIALRGKLIFIQIFSLSNKYWCLNTVPAILRDEEKIQYKSLHSAAPHITSIKIKHNICLFLYISSVQFLEQSVSGFVTISFTRCVSVHQILPGLVCSAFNLVSTEDLRDSNNKLTPPLWSILEFIK